MNDKELLAASIVKALAYTENNGKPDLSNLKAGKTGETKSIFQFTPDTWKRYSKEIFGNEDVQIVPDTETYVTNEKVKKWIAKGYNARQIASMWNAGESKPDAYKQSWKGTNEKYGVGYDTPAYADKVLKYSRQFYQEKKSKSNDTDPLSQSTPVQGKIQGLANQTPANPTADEKPNNIS